MNPRTTRRKAFIYVRISQDRTGAGLGVTRQEEDCMALAEKLGWDVVQVFTDDDVSAYSGKLRPQYRAMLEALKAGAANAVIVWHTDRLHRSPRELEEYLDIAEAHGVTTQTVQAGELDLATPSGRAVARTLGAWARFESEHKADRVRRAQRQAVEAGKWTGGARPFGWQFEDGKPVIDKAEADRVREATRGVIAGRSLGHYVRAFNEAGVTTSMGKPWTYTGLKQVLRRPRNAGLSSWHGEVVGQSVFPAIVSEDEWRACCHVLANPDRRKAKSNRMKYLLPGLAVCQCGAPVKSATATGRDGSSRRVYRCPVKGPGHVAKNQTDADNFVEKVMIGYLQRPDVLAKLAARQGIDTTELEAEAEALRGRLEELALALDNPKAGMARIEASIVRVEARLAEIEGKMIAAARGDAVKKMAGKDAEKKWKAASLEEKRGVIDALATVTLLRTTSGSRREFNPATVDIDFR